MKDAFKAVCAATEDAASKGRRNSAETMLGLSTVGPFDTALGALLVNLAHYADDHRTRFGSPIGQDYVLGEAWIGMLQGLLALLNGETGRLDCGDFDRAIRDVAEAAGFNRELDQP